MAMVKHIASLNRALSGKNQGLDDQFSSKSKWVEWGGNLV